jgi:hypothetical protein
VHLLSIPRCTRFHARPPAARQGGLNDIFGRPVNERPYLVLVVGYPADGARVPVAAGRRKALAEIATFR